MPLDSIAPESTGVLAPPRLERVVSFVSAALSQPVGVRDMAGVACMSPFHFSRVFKRATGHSPHNYLMWKRVERARELLSQTDMPIKDIAHAVGYRTQTHFTSVFRRLAGMSPGRYRKEQKTQAA